MATPSSSSAGAAASSSAAPASVQPATAIAAGSGANAADAGVATANSMERCALTQQPSSTRVMADHSTQCKGAIRASIGECSRTTEATARQRLVKKLEAGPVEHGCCQLKHSELELNNGGGSCCYCQQQLSGSIREGQSESDGRQRDAQRSCTCRTFGGPPAPALSARHARCCSSNSRHPFSSWRG